MNEIPRSYLRLFNAATDAIALIDKMNFGDAKHVLKEGQMWAEELFLAEQEGEVTSEKEMEIFRRILLEEAKAEKELADQEADEEIDAKLEEWVKREGGLLKIKEKEQMRREKGIRLEMRKEAQMKEEAEP